MASMAKSAMASLALIWCIGPAAADVRYQVVDLGVGLFSVIDRQTPAVAANGWIAGTDTFPVLRGYVWKNGTATLIEPPMGSFSIAYDINAAGTSVGITPGPGLNGPFGRPFVRNAGGTLSYIPDLASAPSVNVRAAYGINDAGGGGGRVGAHSVHFCQRRIGRADHPGRPSQRLPRRCGRLRHQQQRLGRGLRELSVR